MDNLVDTNEPADPQVWWRLKDLSRNWHEDHRGSPKYLVLSNHLWEALRKFDQEIETYHSAGVGWRWRSCIVLITEQQDFMELI